MEAQLRVGGWIPISEICWYITYVRVKMTDEIGCEVIQDSLSQTASRPSGLCGTEEGRPEIREENESKFN